MKVAVLVGALTIAAAVHMQAAACFDPGTYRSPDPAAEQNFQRGVSYFQQKDYTAANHYLALAAQRNHPRAQELLGQSYMFGYGVQPDAQTALRYMTASADQGHRGAITDLGFYYSQVTVDLAKADQYFLVSAKCGSLDAQVELGFNYEFARGVEWNRKQAIYWLMQAAPHFGKAGYAAQWLQDPATPHFQNVDQLSNYISAKINQRIVLSLPRNRGPIPGTPGCYANINPACASDPTSAAYKANHSQ